MYSHDPFAIGRRLILKLHPAMDTAFIKLIVMNYQTFDTDIGAKSLTNSATEVILHLDQFTPNGIGSKKVYYLDSMGRFDELSSQRRCVHGLCSMH